MIRALLFDLDGTLIDSTDAIVESYFFAYDSLGVARPAREQIIKSIGLPLAEQFQLLGGVDVDMAITSYREHYHRVAPSKTELLPGVRDGPATEQHSAHDR